MQNGTGQSRVELERFGHIRSLNSHNRDLSGEGRSSWNPIHLRDDAAHGEEDRDVVAIVLGVHDEVASLSLLLGWVRRKIDNKGTRMSIVRPEETTSWPSYDVAPPLKRRTFDLLKASNIKEDEHSL